MKRIVEQPTMRPLCTKEANSLEILDLWIGLRVEVFVPNVCASF